MIPVLDKNSIRVITQAIQPEQVEYVAGVNNLLNTVQAENPAIIENEKGDDVLYVAKIMAFSDKFQNLHWSAASISYHKAIDDFREELEEYKDEIAENIQAIIGQFVGNEFTKLELPIGENPLDVINELKICVNNWLELHADDIEYEGCRNATSGFLQVIHKYIYIFRLCKINSD